MARAIIQKQCKASFQIGIKKTMEDSVEVVEPLRIIQVAIKMSLLRCAIGKAVASSRACHTRILPIHTHAVDMLEKHAIILGTCINKQTMCSRCRCISKKKLIEELLYIR